MRPKTIKALCIVSKEKPQLKALEIFPIKELKEIKLPKGEEIWEVEIKAVQRIK